ncbi:glycosyltransferase [Candidatus Dependentiae bacterium]|nr:glycosyltransferase [Candidatus Dependentiae bacterium]
MKVVIAAGGRFHAFHLARQLEKRMALKKLYTGSYTNKDSDYVNQKFIEQNYYFDYLSDFFLKFRFYKFLNKSKLHTIKDNLFDYWLSKKIKKEGEFDIFVGWANYFFNSIKQIKKAGAKVIIECGSTHILEQQKLLQEEYQKFGLNFSPICKKNLEKVLAEYNVADYIMTCSNFTYKSFLKHGISANKMLKVPYGVNLDIFGKKSKKSDGKFRVICVGLMCLRKGIPYLLKAWKKLNLPENKSELLLVGNVQKDLKYFLKNFDLPGNVVFYGSTNRKSLADLYIKSDIFVLPSIEEGLSMTIAEAMASGLPIICTTNTGGEELIEEGKQGFILPIRDSEFLAEKILWFYENKSFIQEMGMSAKKKIKNFSWDVYGQKIFDTYKKIIEKK